MLLARSSAATTAPLGTTTLGSAPPAPWTVRLLSNKNLLRQVVRAGVQGNDRTGGGAIDRCLEVVARIQGHVCPKGGYAEAHHGHQKNAYRGFQEWLVHYSAANSLKFTGSCAHGEWRGRSFTVAARLDVALRWRLGFAL